MSLAKMNRMQIVFTTEELLEVAIETWSELGLNPQPVNSVQTLKLTELSGHYMHLYILLNI